MTRRVVLAAVVGFGLTMTAVAGAADQQPAGKEKPRNPLYSSMPSAVRAVFEDAFPNHVCIRLVRRQEKGATMYRGTVFDSASGGAQTKRVGEEIVTEPILYHLEISETGKVLEETLRPVFDPKQLPKAVLAAYEKWNPKGVTGSSGHWWMTEVPRGEARVYRVRIILSAVKAYSASFKEDGTVLAADPAVVP
jgi:hypothetical protein